ncbi:MAG: dihydroorotase [Thermoleophilia bacterium]|nr:dihydroorotase [Thermoleophilia bacterium]
MDTSKRPSAPRLACRAALPETFFIPSVRLFDPQHGVDVVGDLLVEEGKIARLGEAVKRASGVETLDDLAGCWVFPGFVDPHAHLRTPGYEYKEDLSSGPLAAAAGGYVVVVAMANTDPVVDCGPVAAWVLDEAARYAAVRVGQVGAVSKGLKGEELAEMRELADAGVIAFSDDGKPIADADLLLHALRYARGTGRALLVHLENRSLSLDGIMHEGRWSARLGLRGVPAACESGPLARDLEIVRYVDAENRRLVETRRGEALETGAAPGASPDAAVAPMVHFQHLSAADSVRLVRRAKEEGLPVTAEATPHHLLLTDELLTGFDQNLKVNPPIRSAEDRVSLVAALADGTIDCIGTDHAPHAPQEKEVPIEDALPGTTGLETAFAALHTGLVLTGQVPLGRLVEAMSGAPCRVLGLTEPRLAEGAPADFCVVDLEERWRVAPETLRGKSRNCAFLGETLTGRVRLTVVDGARRFARARGEG